MRQIPAAALIVAALFPGSFAEASPPGSPGEIAATAPLAEVTPDSLHADLSTGESDTQQITLSNTGDSDLVWQATLATLEFGANQVYTLHPPEAPGTTMDIDTGRPNLHPDRTASIQAELADLTGMNIMWDLAHGQPPTADWSIIIADLESRGAVVTINQDPWTPGMLAGFDVIWFGDVNTGLTPSEMVALSVWTNAGGGLLLQGDDLATVQIYNQILTDLGAGFQYVSSPVEGGNISTIYAHPTTNDVNTVYFSASSASITGIGDPAQALVEDDAGVVGAAAGTVGNGKIVGVSDELFHNTWIGNADNQLLGNQALDWLASQNFFSIFPASGTLPASESAPLDVTFDAQGLLDGTYSGLLSIVSNDSTNSPLDVAVNMEVTGIPHFVVEPDTLNFGERFVGYSSVKNFSLSNTGTDVLHVTAMTAGLPEWSVSPETLSVGPGEIVQAQMTLTPTLGTLNTTLTIDSNDPGSPHTLTLLGSGVLPPVVGVSQESLVADVVTGEADTQQVTLSNTGDSDLVWSAALSDFSYGSSIEAQPADLTGLNIMWDHSHGQPTPGSWSSLIGDLKSRGAVVTVNDTPWTLALISAYDIIWSGDVNVGLSPVETSALASWITAGGSLLLEGDNLATVQIYNAFLTALGAGFQYESSPVMGGEVAVYPHPTTENVAAVFFSPSSASIVGLSGAARPLAEDGMGVVGAAASAVGTGQIVGVTDELFKDSWISNADNQRFGNQIMDWLAHEVFFTVSPPSGVIPAGENSVLDVTFDPQDLGGDYSGLMTIVSNDPATPALDISAVMHVTGVPMLALEPDTLDFGGVIVGIGNDSMTLSLSNQGTDSLAVTNISAGLPDWSIEPTALMLPPGALSDVLVTFSPQIEGDRNTILTIDSSDPESPHTVELLGFGALPPLAGVSPDSLHADLLTGETQSQQVTLSNTGGSDLKWTASLSSLISENNQVYTLQSPEPPGTSVDVDTGQPALEPGRTVSIQAELADLTGVHIMRDRSHGQPPSYSWSTLAADLTSRGATITDNNDPWTPALLAPYQVILSGDVDLSLAAQEMDALTAWINAGGGLFLEGDNLSTVSIYNEILVALGAGFQYVSSPVNPGYVTGIYPHPTTQNLSTVYFTGSSASINNVTVPGQRLIKDDGGTVGAAAAAVGLGKIAGVSDELFQNSSIGLGDNQLFANQIVDWLSSSPVFSISPSAGTVPPGDSATVNVLFDAQGLIGGTYSDSVRVISNDPGNPELDVPVTLQVTGAPQIVLEPAGLDFGTQFVGYPDSLNLTVSNAGTDTLTVIGITAGLPDWSIDPSFLVLPAGASTDVLVIFTPQDEGDLGTVLTVSSNAPGSPHTLPLLGSGAFPPIVAVSPDSLHADLLTGETQVQQVTLSNPGGSDLTWSAEFSPLADGNNQAYPFPSLKSKQGAPTQATLADLTGINIMWDLQHGQPGTANWIALVTDLRSRGATVTTNSDSWTTARLSEYNIIWFGDVDVALTSSETSALAGWIYSGGGLLLEGDNLSSVSIYNQILTALNAGFRYGSSPLGEGNTNNIFSHPTTENVTAVYISSSSSRIQQVVVPAQPLVQDIRNATGAAASMPGSGKIVGVSDELFHNSHIGAADNRLFGNQVMDWLAHLGNLSVAPYVGTIPAGGSTLLDVTLNAEGISGGNYSSFMRIASNDPLTPTLEVPVTLQVTGVPQLSLESGSLDFGPGFVGYPDTLSFTVTNLGTGTLEITDMTAGLPDWSAWPTSLELTVGAWADVFVAFDPQSDGDRSTDLTLTSNDPNSPHTLQLDGSALFPPIVSTSPDTLVTAAAPGSTAVTTLALCNTGNSDLEWSSGLAPLTHMVTLYTPDSGKAMQDVDTGAADPDGGRTSAVQAELADLTDITIMWDRAHGQTSTAAWEIIIQDFESRGATLTVNNDPWTLDMLSEYNVVWLIDTHTPLTASEQADLLSWIAGGGSLLIEGDDTDSVPVYNAILSTLGAGIEYSTTAATSGSTGNVFPHATTENVGRIYLSGVAASLTNISSPGGLLFNDPYGTPVGAYSEIGVGHLVCISDEVFQNSRMDNDDNRLFGNQVMDWLALAPIQWLSVLPREGVLAPGACTDLTVTTDATYLVHDDYYAVLIVHSNVPGAPSDKTPVTFHVGIVSADDPTPTVHALLQNAPNPFWGSTQIVFDLPVEEHVDLRVYDVQGRLVRILKNQVLPEGRYQADWDGRDYSGHPAALGVYFYRLRAGSFTATRQMTLVR